MPYIHLMERDVNGTAVSDRYINSDQIATITVEADSTSVAVVMSNGDCIVAPSGILQELDLTTTGTEK